VDAYWGISDPQIKSEVQKIFKFDPQTNRRSSDPQIETRKDLQHYNPLQDGSQQARDGTFNLNEYVNRTRSLMSYDRKLKNAVSKAIIELLETSENMKLTWECDHIHKLSDARIETDYAKHLGGTGDQEPLSSGAYRSWMTLLFNGAPVN